MFIEAVILTKSTYIDRYGYSEYGIGFDRHGSISFPSTGSRRNVIISGVDMSSSTKIDNRKKYFGYTRTRTYTECRKNVFD